MAEPRYPTTDEFWRRLSERETERDLRDELGSRTRREGRPVQRVGHAETVVAVVARLLPGTAVPPEALAAFLDDTFDQQLGRGDERDGTLPRAALIPLGFQLLEDAAGGSFAGLSAEQQDALLARAERRELEGPAGFDSGEWFSRVRSIVLLGFGSDPRGMVHMGYPGPSYRPGYVWLDTAGVRQRQSRAPGFRGL